ncbi:hypothetical protein OIU79_023741 [Salix purpurea]|uniref:NAC domain-containing protein n=1 Tax=Salix purpurea TaxID=77065 RepID=A0A9Q0WAJ9_SALPP|nr:hypothetical protein OIU79_023741 [Salix purpurea]
MKNPQSSLPPGFRFHPTDEELILHYLKKKLASTPFPVSVIADVDIYKFDPWDLPAQAVLGEKEWYFFSPRDRKYPNGARPNRAAASGYWKATGTDKIIMASTMAPKGVVIGGQENIGVKKALVFYRGKPPKGVKTDWIMHEYRLAETPTYTNNRSTKPKDSSMRLDDWVLCRIYKKSLALTSSPRALISSEHGQEEEEEEQRFVEETLLPISSKNTLMPQKSCSFSNLFDATDYSMLRSFLADTQFNPAGFESNPALNGSTAQLDQTFFGNSDSASNSNSTSSDYFLQKLPQLNNSTPNYMHENKLKRQLSHLDEEMPLPSKKYANSCSFTNTSNNSQTDMGQYSFLSQQFLNQQLLLSPHLQFTG